MSYQRDRDIQRPEQDKRSTVPVKEVAGYLDVPQYVCGEVNGRISIEQYEDLCRYKEQDPSGFANMVEQKRWDRQAAVKTKQTVKAIQDQLFIGPEKARSRLGLEVWQVALAVSAGMLDRHPEGFLVEDIDTICDDIVAYRERLVLEEHINAPDAAAILEIPRKAFDELVAAKRVTAVSEGSFKYGVYYNYRRGDIVDMVAEMPAFLAARRAATDQRRSAGKQKAQVTRAANTEKAKIGLCNIRDGAAELALIGDPAQRCVAMVGYWVELVSAMADSAQQKARANYRRPSGQQHWVVADACYKAKNSAIRALVSANSRYVKWAFLDGSYLWLCNSCRDTAYQCGIHPRDWISHCKHCTINHNYSLVHCAIQVGRHIYQTVTPVPVAADLDIGPASRVVHDRRHGVVESLPRWILDIRQACSVSRDRLGSYNILMDPRYVRSFSYTVAIESLRAAISDLRELTANTI